MASSNKFYWDKCMKYFLDDIEKYFIDLFLNPGDVPWKMIF